MAMRGDSLQSFSLDLHHQEMRRFSATYAEVAQYTAPPTPSAPPAAELSAAMPGTDLLPDLASAQAAADKLGIPKAYGSYEELLADPAIEAIYNPLPNDLHVPLTLAAARAGKHVLCEKPIALNAEEAAQLREVGDKVHIMEAFMVRFHPQWLRTRELVQSGALGELRTVQAWFSYFNRNPENIRNDASKGGGALFGGEVQVHGESSYSSTNEYAILPNPQKDLS